jgi:hypothetical protein
MPLIMKTAKFGNKCWRCNGNTFERDGNFLECFKCGAWMSKYKGEKIVKLTVEYLPEEKNLKLVSDGDAELYVLNIVKSAKNSAPIVLLTSQELIIDYVRLFIVLEEISHRDVEFRFKDNVMYPDKYGHLDCWPTGFCDYRDNLTNRLLQGMFDTKELK